MAESCFPQNGISRLTDKETHKSLSVREGPFAVASGSESWEFCYPSTIQCPMGPLHGMPTLQPSVLVRRASRPR